MRDWWRYNVETQLDRSPVNWDTMFLWAWVFYALNVILSGGTSV